MRDVMAEELSGGLEEPCWSDGLLQQRGERCQMNEQRHEEQRDVRIEKGKQKGEVKRRRVITERGQTEVRRGRRGQAKETREEED